MYVVLLLCILSENICQVHMSPGKPQVWTAELNMDVEIHSSDEEDVGHLVWGSSSLLS